MLMNDNISHFIWFSGGGFHVWIPLKETLSPKSGNELSRIKHSGRVLINSWEKKIGTLRCNDPTVAFDTSGMIRIPNSYNARRECWSIPLSSEDILNGDFDYYMDKAQESHSGYIELGENKLELKIIKSRIMNMADVKPIEIPTVFLDDVIILPCLSQAAQGS